MVTFDKHPFLQSLLGTSFNSYFPPQMISYKEKRQNLDENGISSFDRINMDFAFSYARSMMYENEKLEDNEKLVNGEMIRSIDPDDFCEDCDEEYTSILARLEDSGDLPRTIKNYDIIGTPIREQVTEFDQRPDTLSVEGFGEPLENDRYKVQKDGIQKWAFEQLNLYFGEYLTREGIDPNQEFNSQEELEQFQQFIESKREERNPEELGQYMKYDYRHYFVEWAMYELEDQIERFKLKNLRRREFYNYLVVGRRFRFLNITPDGLSIEPLNWKNVYFQKDQNTPYVQHGDFVGTIMQGSASHIVNKYGHLLTEKQLRSLDSFSAYWDDKQARSKTDFFGNKVDYLDTDGNPYNTYLPSKDPVLNRLAPNLGINWISPLTKVVNGGLRSDQYYIVHHFWRSYIKVGRLAWINPVTQLFEVIEVDETFVKPAYIKVLTNGTFSDEVQLNTLIWTWKEELWEGKLISNYTLDNNVGNIYFDIKPCEYQGGTFRFKNKPLPIVGQLNYSPNIKHSTQIDIFKPYAYIHNIAMNKGVKMMELSYAAFVAMEMRNIPNKGDWGGDDGIFKWIESAQDTGIGVLDTSAGTTQGANDSGAFPRIVDIDNTNRALAFFNMAASIRMLAYNMLGIGPQRLMDVKGVDPVTGLDESLAKAYNSTETWVTEFWEAEAEIVKQQLEVAQWLQSQNKDFTALLSKGIISESILTNNFDNFDLFDMRIYVSNSQEKLRQLELYKKLALDNTTDAAMSTRMQMAGTSNAQIILNIVKEEEAKAQARREQLEQMQIQMQQETEETKRQELAIEYQKHLDKLENDIKVAYIRSMLFANNQNPDADNSGTPDVLEYEKFMHQANKDLESIGVSKEKLALEREKEMNRRTEVIQQNNLKQQEINQKREAALLTSQNVKYLDKGTFKGNTKK